MVTTKSNADLAGINKVLVLNVGQISEDIATGTMTYARRGDMSSYSRVMSIIASECLIKREIESDVDSVSFSNFDVKKRNLTLYKLSRGIVDPAIIEDIATLGATDGVAVLSISVYDKIGVQGSWDMNSGAITSNASNTTLRATIIDCKTARILWQSEVFVRHPFDPYNAVFKKAANDLFATLIPPETNLRGKK
jgi:hypothetical protein